MYAYWTLGVVGSIGAGEAYHIEEGRALMFIQSAGRQFSLGALITHQQGSASLAWVPTASSVRPLHGEAVLVRHEYPCGVSPWESEQGWLLALQRKPRRGRAR